MGADEPPHRLRGLQAHRIGESVTNTRITTPPADAAGEVPPAVAAVPEAFGKLGLPELMLAGVDDHTDGHGRRRREAAPSCPDPGLSSL